MPRRKSSLLKHPVFLLSLASVVLFTPFRTLEKEAYVLRNTEGKGILMYEGSDTVAQPFSILPFVQQTSSAVIRKVAKKPELTHICAKKTYIKGSVYSRVGHFLEQYLKIKTLRYVVTPQGYQAWLNSPRLHFMTVESQDSTIAFGDKDYFSLYEPFENYLEQLQTKSNERTKTRKK